MFTRRIFAAVMITAAIAFSANSAVAQPRIPGFGFGIILGEPSGLTFKGPAGGRNAWDASIGPSWFGRVRITADYMWNVNAFSSNKAGMYFGFGAAVALGRGRGVLYHGKGNDWYYFEDENGTGIGVRGLVGVNFMPFTAPIEIFGELGPLFGVSPATGFGWDAAIGLRYYP